MEEQQLSEKESLELISRMINTAKNTYYESGLGPLLWGFTNMICFVVTYMNEKVKGFSFPFNPFLLMIFTFIIHIYFDNKEKKYKSVTTHLEEAHRWVWVAFGISVIVLTFGAGFANFGYGVFPPLLIIFAIPTFVSGCVNKFYPLIIGGAICWLLGLAAFFTRTADCYLLAAAGATVAWIIPGFILRYRFIRNRFLQHGV